MDDVLGLLNEEDGGRTDLGTLEKLLQEKSLSRRASAVPGSSATSPVHSTPGGPGDVNGLTPRSTIASPEPNKDSEKHNSKDSRNGESEEKEEPVEALSDMMCSLVTNNCGETRYIGTKHRWIEVRFTDKVQDHLLDFLYFHQKVSHGSTRKQATLLFKK